MCALPLPEVLGDFEDAINVSIVLYTVYRYPLAIPYLATDTVHNQLRYLATDTVRVQ